MQNTRAWLLSAVSAFAAVWAGVLVKAHHAAVLHTLEPGLLCGADGGCGEILSSEWATIGGIAVSAPAIPLFAAIAVLAALVALGRLDPRRVAGLATGAGLVGLAFGGWLLWHMLVDVQHVCRYCLIMDAATAGVLGAGLLLHPDGPAGALREVGAAARRLAELGPELATALAVVIGTATVTLLFPEPTEAATAFVAVDAAGQALPGQAAASGDTRQITIPPGHVEVHFTDTTPILGPPDAPVTIVLFEDFQCPFCRKLTGNLDALRREDPAKVRLAWFHFPMHSACNARPGMVDMHADACGAAVAAECARRQGKFWEYHDRLFADQRLSAEDVVADARELGLDLTAFAACQADPSAREKVVADSEEGRRFNITGTPTWFVNGKRFTGAHPVEALRAITAAILASDDQQQIAVPTEGEVLGDVGARPEAVELAGPRGSFRIDTFEATVVDGVARSLPNREPTRGLPWADAAAACEAAGKRLCAEDEWLTACIGALPVDADGDGTYSDDPQPGRQHPYGPYPQATWCASDRSRTDERPVLTGNHPRCLTPEGVADLEGGLKEWVGLSPSLAALQGGSYFSKDAARCAFHKMNEAPDVRDAANGFRCCSGPAPDVVSLGPPGGRVGDTVQSWSVATLDGGKIDATSLAGKPYILVFWASWCGPCRKELPVLIELYERYHPQGLEVVAVTIDAAAGPAKKFLTEMPLPFQVGFDPQSELMKRFDATSPPTSFFVTRSGKIRQRNVGYDEKGGAAVLEGHIRGLLAAP